MITKTRDMLAWVHLGLKKYILLFAQGTDKIKYIWMETTKE